VIEADAGTLARGGVAALTLVAECRFRVVPRHEPTRETFI